MSGFISFCDCLAGVSSFAQSSQGVTAQPDENFEFKDNSDFYNDDYLAKQPLGTLPASAMYEEGMMQVQKPDSRYSFIDSRLSPVAMLNDRYYTRHAANGYAKKQDFKVILIYFCTPHNANTVEVVLYD